MPFYAYRKPDGTQVSFIHKVDWLTAVKSGNFTANPPGTPQEAPKPPKVKGEKIQDVDPEKDKAPVDPEKNKAPVDPTKPKKRSSKNQTS